MWRISQGSNIGTSRCGSYNIKCSKEGVSRYTTRALAEDRVDIIPLAASRDLNKFNGIKPSDGIIQKSLSESN